MGGPNQTSDVSKAQFYNTLPQLPGMTSQFNQQAQQNANGITTPTLNTDFTAKGGLDSFSQGLLSQGQQTMQNQLSATQGAIASKFRGPMAGVLQSQAEMQSRLNSNPLMFNVAAAQVGRNQQEQTLGNNALLSQQQATNNALTTKAGLQALPMAAQQSLLQTLQSGYKK